MNQQPAIPDPSLSLLYEQDAYTWALRNAELIRAGRFSEVDWEHVAEEVEAVGKSEWRELENRLIVLLAHLLKWQYQTERRGRSWQATIKEQRHRLRRVLEANPGLKPHLDTILKDAFATAVLVASRETDLDESIFPAICPFSYEAIIANDFWPE